MKQTLLEKAEKHIFSTGMDDSTSLLAKANMKYGLAKMHFIQEKFGLEPNATFVSSPDETISRNTGRWNRGISYGGKITWGSGKEKLIMLDTKPNACGMAVGALDKIPKLDDTLKEIHRLEQEDRFINDIKIRWDFKKGNHFIDVFKVKNLSGLKLPRYAVILHAGCSELKGANDKGPGLYHDEMGWLKDIMKEVKTPFGPSAVLEGSYAREYMKFHDFAVDFAKQRRELALKEIFGIKRFVLNQPHQFMPHQNQTALGCHDSKPGGLYPVSLRGDKPSFLVLGKKNFTLSWIKELGFQERAEQLGVMKRLLNANLVPHGGGYMFPALASMHKVHELGGERFFELDMEHGNQKEIVMDVKDVVYDYRGLEVFEKTKKIGLCEPVAELSPVYVIKI